jgi:ribose/xylose/arabinose/galactoside ABC-type transport system permease subunit
MRRLVTDPYFRPLALLAVVFLGFAVTDFGGGNFFSAATLTGGLETFGTIGLVTLGLGMTMVMGEFDLSVPGVFGMAGCIAVLTGAHHPLVGAGLAVAAGLIAGVVQGFIVSRLRLPSVGVTLGGLLITVGVAYVLTNSASISYDNLEVALAMSDLYGGIFSVRTMITFVLFAVAAIIMTFTRLGRDIVATGSDRSAALLSGVNVGALVVCVFAVSGALSALSGAMLSYSLASASPAGLSDVLVPAVTAAIIGGVSLGGGAGRPFGIAIGVLILATLRSGFNAIGAEPWVSEVTTSGALLVVAALDTPVLTRRFQRLLPRLQTEN